MLYQIARAYSQDIRDRVFAASDAGNGVRPVAERLHVSVSCVSKARTRRRTTGETVARTGRGGDAEARGIRCSDPRACHRAGRHHNRGTACVRRRPDWHGKDAACHAAAPRISTRSRAEIPGLGISCRGSPYRSDAVVRPAGPGRETVPLYHGRTSRPDGDAGLTHVNPRHHSTASVPGLAPAVRRLQHVMLETESIDDVTLALDIMQQRGLEMGRVGCHTSDLMISFHLVSPSGFNVGYGWGGRAIDDESTWTVENYRPTSAWGHGPRR